MTIESEIREFLLLLLFAPKTNERRTEAIGHISSLLNFSPQESEALLVGVAHSIVVGISRLPKPKHSPSTKAAPPAKEKKGTNNWEMEIS